MPLSQFFDVRPLRLAAMSGERTPSEGARTPKKPLHIHVPSLTTNASGIAESTITNASDISGLSQFPSPPLQVPTPSLSSFNSTPTTSRFADRLTSSVPDYHAPAPNRFAYGTPPTPPSPVDSKFSGNAKDENGLGRNHYSAQLAHNQDIPHPVKTHSSSSRAEDARNAVGLRMGTSSSSGSRRHQPMGPRQEKGGSQQQSPPTSLRFQEGRGISPLSTIASFTYTDGNDTASLAASGISGISVNPSEEALLTTSFITSLLSNSPEPFPGERLSDARRKFVRRLDKPESEASSQTSRRHRGATRSADTHQSVPTSVAPYHLSSLMPADVPTTAKLPPSISDHDSIVQPSSLSHSEKGLVQLVTRKPSISYLGGAATRPVGFVPAYRVSIGPSDSSNRTSVNSGLTSSTMSSKPPGHRADAPRDVTQGNAFEHESGPRESEEDFARLSGVDFRAEKREGPTSPALPSTAGSKSKFSNIDMRLKSSLNLSSSSPSPAPQKEGQWSKGHSLQRTNSRKSVVSSIITMISHASAAQRDKYMAWMSNRPLPPLPPMPTNPAPQIPNSREIQSREESIPLPTLARRADHLQVMLNRGKYPTSSGYNSQFDYKENSSEEDEYRNSGRHSYAQIRATGTVGTRLSVFSRFRKNKEAQDYAGSKSPISPKLASLEQRKKKRRRLWIICACVLIGIILVIAIPVGIFSFYYNRHEISFALGTLGVTLIEVQTQAVIIQFRAPFHRALRIFLDLLLVARHYLTFLYGSIATLVPEVTTFPNHQGATPIPPPDADDSDNTWH